MTGKSGGTKPRLERSQGREYKLLALFLLLAAVLFGLFRLGSDVLQGDTFAIDRAILRSLRSAGDPATPIGPAWLARAMIDLTSLGSVAVLTLVSTFSIGFLISARRLASAAYVAVSVAGGALLGSALKALFFRPRPEIVPHLVQVSSTSFPSGHAVNSAVVYLTLGMLVARAQSRERVRVYLIGTAICLTLLIGFSRVYLGVHWPSDVVAGWCVGAMWAGLCAWAERLL